MTKPHYRNGCPAGSQEHGEASAWRPSPASNAWIVNFNNGNSNGNNRNNNARVRAVRSVSSAGECQGAESVSLRSLHQAWQRARRHKVPSTNQLRWEARWMDRLIELQERIQAGTWSPSPSTCFIADQPKTREIHAPSFGDRVVHHWLVPQLEAAFDRTFIHDSFSNRAGKGTHAAVDRLRSHVRAVHSGEGGGYYLQMDVANFFNSIDRARLWRRLKGKMQRARLPMTAQRVAHALLRSSPTATGVVHVGSAEARARVPRHKRLEAAAPGCGIPIGNLSSQFLANLCLDELDQFVKHELKVKRYVRYVDDFVLVHSSRAQLLLWKRAIERFLWSRLRLNVKRGSRLLPLSAGVDFLGYVIFPEHVRVRARVVDHARNALRSWAASRVRAGRVRATPSECAQLRSVWSSYEGHFRRAASWRLRRQFHERFPWLESMTRLRRFAWWADARVMPFRCEVVR